MSGNVSPYLELALRSEEEVRRARLLSKTLDRLATPSPAQEWLDSDRVTKALERFRKEDETNNPPAIEGV